MSAPSSPPGQKRPGSEATDGPESKRSRLSDDEAEEGEVRSSGDEGDSNPASSSSQADLVLPVSRASSQASSSSRPGSSHSGNDLSLPSSSGGATAAAAAAAAAASSSSSALAASDSLPDLPSSLPSTSSGSSSSRKESMTEEEKRRMKERRRLEQEKEERDKMLVLVSNFTEEQLDRYEMFRRAAFPKASIKRIVQTIAGTSVGQNVVISMAGIAKVFVGEVIEEALDYQERVGDGGSPLKPKHLREAARVLREKGKLPKTRPKLDLG